MAAALFPYIISSSPVHILLTCECPTDFSPQLWCFRHKSPTPIVGIWGLTHSHGHDTHAGRVGKSSHFHLHCASHVPSFLPRLAVPSSFKPVNSNLGQESSFPVSFASRPARRPSKQTTEAAAEHKQEVSSLNPNLSSQACSSCTQLHFTALQCLREQPSPRWKRHWFSNLQCGRTTQNASFVKGHEGG